MISLNVRSDGLHEAIRHVQAIRDIDMEPIGRAVADALFRGNARARIAGTDQFGQPLAPLRSKRKGKYRNATGPPLAPFDGNSRSANPTIDVERTSENHVVVRMRWPDMPWLIAHIRPDFPLPKRDIAHIDAPTWAAIAEAVRVEVSRQIYGE